MAPSPASTTAATPSCDTQFIAPDTHEDMQNVTPTWRCNVASPECTAAVAFYHRLRWAPWLKDRLEWFQDLKFGIMYCWGLQTQFGTVDQSWCLCPERYDWNKRPAPYENADTLTFKQAYEGLQKTFNPVKFDPARDARIAEEAGAKYLVFCTKHHDGFCFFDTQTTDYKITSKACPFATNENANVTKQAYHTADAAQRLPIVPPR